MDNMDTQIAPPQSAGDPTVALFLGLYLVLLAFFIMLVSISTPEETKSQKVMNSLSTAFPSIVPPIVDSQFKSTDDGVLAGQEFQQQVTGIFATELGIDKVETIQPGRQMRLILASDNLFFQGEARIRPAMFPLLDRTVAALSNRPAGMRFDLEFVIGTPTLSDGKTMPIAQTLEIARAGAFARAMFERGIPPDSVSVGMRPGHVGEVVIWFYTRDIAADKLRLDDAKKTEN